RFHSYPDGREHEARSAREDDRAHAARAARGARGDRARGGLHLRERAVQRALPRSRWRPAHVSAPAPPTGASVLIFVCDAKCVHSNTHCTRRWAISICLLLNSYSYMSFI